MIVGIDVKNNFGVRNISVIKFVDRTSAEFWLNQKHYDSRDRSERSIFDSEEKAMDKLAGYDWNRTRKEKALNFAKIGTLNKEKGYISYEDNHPYINR